MSHYGGDDPYQFVQDLSDHLNLEVETGEKGVQDWIEGQVHSVAVGLLHSMLPPLVHANTSVVKISESTTVIGAGGVVGFTIGTADVGNTVLAGAVADKVKEGIGELRSDSDYARGVNSITW
ncbi:hypothetical protein [Leifsonia sp. 2MCAF36]|uniref:hypothetical protein n=1 Tax=Leifsonia sp. 2MCAF36 TaxID=3232988 RepID=UPI003F9DF578